MKCGQPIKVNTYHVRSLHRRLWEDLQSESGMSADEYRKLRRKPRDQQRRNSKKFYRRHTLACLMFSQLLRISNPRKHRRQSRKKAKKYYWKNPNKLRAIARAYYKRNGLAVNKAWREKQYDKDHYWSSKAHFRRRYGAFWESKFIAQRIIRICVNEDKKLGPIPAHKRRKYEKNNKANGGYGKSNGG